MPTSITAPDFEKRLIQSFSKHVLQYDRHAQLQKNMAERLATLLPPKLPATLLEIGCGTGLFTRHLLARHPHKLILNDIAPPMLEHVREQMQVPEETSWISGNAESLKFPQADLISANAVFQWFQFPAESIRKLAHTLNGGGRLIFSTFGPKTLEEFRAAGSLKGPTPLLSEEDWCRILSQAGLELKESVTEERQIFYPDTKVLVKNLQQIGAAPFRMLSHGELKNLIREYDRQYMTPQGVYTHWELKYLKAKRN